MSSTVDTLIEMGFSKHKAELAVTRTGSQDIQIVMDWIMSHEDELEESASNTNPESVQAPSEGSSSQNNIETAPSESAEEPSPLAKSIKCDDCGKLFKSNEEVEFHAAKSGHSNFSESTEEKQPLSETEKKEQLAKIEAKLRQRRMEREAREKEEALLREKNRIKSGKEMLEAKKKHEELEMKKIVEQRKREKEEERLAKQRVRDLIEQDKLARQAKFSGQPATQPPAAAAPAVPAAPKPAPNYSEVRLQIRLPDGSGLTQTFGAKEPLSAVRLFVEMSHKIDQIPFSFMLSYPRKVFSGDDWDKPLELLDLAPSAVLIVKKN